MRPIDGDRGAVQPGHGAEGRTDGLRAPGLDVAALWREVFAVEAGGAGEAGRTGGAGESSSVPPSGVAVTSPPAAVGRGIAAAEGAGGAAPQAAGHRPPLRRNAAIAAPAVRARAAGAGAETGCASTATPLATPDAAAGIPAAGGNVPGPSSGRVQSTASGEALGPSPACPPMTAGREAALRECTDAASSADRTVASTGRPVDAERAAPTSWPPESVQVRCHDGAVDVIVRDAGLAPADAIRCSLETAYALRGERAALRRVSLNGRTVFERAAASSAERDAAGRLCFAC